MPNTVEMPKAACLAILLALCLLSLYFFSFVQKTGLPFTHAFYIPIVIAAFWWRWRGVAVAVFLGAALLVSHAVSPFYPQFEASVANALIFVAIGAMVALIDTQKPKTVGENEWRETTRRKEEIFSALFHTIPISMAISRLLTGEYIDINDTFLTITGYTREEVLGRNSLALNLWVKPEVGSRMRSEIVSGKRVKEIPIQLRTKTGKIIDILYSSEIIELGKDMFTISTARDITERNRTEEALRESEERLRTFLNCTADLVFLKDSQSLHIFANKALADFFGRQVEEVIGKSDFELMPPEAARNCRTSDKKALDEKRVIYTEEIAGDRYFETIKFPVPLGEGRKGIGGFIRDITERRQSEERIRAGLEEKEALIREIHHRVKNNLQAMISLMHMRGEDIDDEKTTLFLKELEEQARTMSLVYEQLYQSSSLASVDMESYLRQLSSHVLVAFGSGRSIPINLRAQSMSFDVALAMPCGLITNELLTNSLKYAFPEGIESIPAIDISLERDGNSYVLTVADNGIGLQSGFDWRASRTLGLRLVNLWVTHQLGGTLDITSGGGMSCTIRFEEQERGA